MSIKRRGGYWSTRPSVIYPPAYVQGVSEASQTRTSKYVILRIALASLPRQLTERPRLARLDREGHVTN